MAIIKSDSGKAKTKWNERNICHLLATGMFDYRRNHVCVPNCSHGYLAWEADLLVCSKSGYLTEVEIKTSMADWKSDHAKYKHKLMASGWHTCIKNFYYAAPEKLARRWQEVTLPDHAGVIAIIESPTGSAYAEVIKPCVTNKMAEKKTPELMATLSSLTAIRVWDLMRINQDLIDELHNLKEEIRHGKVQDAQM